MFKGFAQRQSFHGFPNNNFRGNQLSRYDFGGVVFLLDASIGISTNINQQLISFWTEQFTGTSYFQNTAANQPKWNESDANFNGHSSIEVLSDRSSQLNSLTPISTGQTLAFVSRYFLGSQPFNCIGGIDVNNLVYMGGINAGITGPGARAGGSYFFSSITQTTLPMICVMNQNGVWVNGIQAKSDKVFFDRISFQSILRVGNNAGYSLAGAVAEIIGYSDNIDGLELSNRINQKYAIY